MGSPQMILLLGAFLFSIGLTVLIVKRNTIMMLIGLELIINASTLNLVVFNQMFPGKFDGQMSAVFVMIVAVCEAAVGLALALRVYRFYQTSIPDEISELKG